jgi:K+-transporting ATPase ATPase C chain
MKRTLISSVVAVVVFTLLLGLAYPLVMTGVSQVVFPGKANGSKIRAPAAGGSGHGKVVGSSLLAQDFSRPTGRKDADGNPITEPDPKYFQPRPSQTGYDPSATFFSNRGPNQKSAKAFYDEQIATYLKLERPYNPGLTVSAIPVDAVTTSGSGVDPLISKDNAAIQARRVAAVRGIPLSRVRQLIDDKTSGRFLGFVGEAGVNVTELNLALDSEAR